MTDYTNKKYPGYRFNCSRCEQEFELDVFLSRLVNLGETEVEIALCLDCQQKLCPNVWLPFFAPDLRNCH